MPKKDARQAYDESVQILNDRNKIDLNKIWIPDSHSDAIDSHGRGMSGLRMLEEVVKMSADGPDQEMLANARIATGFYAGDMSYDVTKELVGDVLGGKFARGEAHSADDMYLIESRRDIAETGLNLAAEGAAQAFLLMIKAFVDCRGEIWRGTKADKAYMEIARTKSDSMLTEVRKWAGAKNPLYVRESFLNSSGYLWKIHEKVEDGSATEEYLSKEYSAIEDRVQAIKTSGEDREFMETRVRGIMEWAVRAKPGDKGVSREELDRRLREANPDLSGADCERELGRRNVARQKSGWQDIYRERLLESHGAGKAIFYGPSGRS